ncbi:sigma-70 family RNA polymerase sigma factor [Flaviflexus huanghaiensis]|uniref:sigma-70 family RNA polymerase sigma factor n=1 Tax=Flaviflexus huanghaiensis TaxID=1111473 RepID=UPI0015F985FC|nr:sigma-70 family RNA polymerase sigma factor [Flaviflexus huanghaiensis]
MLLATIVRVVRDRDLAEEVLHECFTYIWTSAQSFNPARGSGTGWLVTLARSRAIDCVRSTASQRKRDTVQGIREINVTSRSVADEVETRIESARAATALRLLPPEQGRMIALVYYEGLTHQQVADRTGVPLGTVKTRVRDGLKKLRDEMERVR